MLTQCVACGGRLEICFADVRDPLTNKSFAIKRCTGCNLGHTDPQPVDLAPYYASVYYGNRHGFTLSHCLSRRLRLVSEATGKAQDRRLLDIGCGDGSFLVAARQKGWLVTGTELNPHPARTKGLDVREDLRELASEEPFDCITMWHTLEHMRDLTGVLAQARSLLKPGGRLIVAVPDSGGLQADIFRNRWLHLDVPRHLYHLNNASLTHCLTSTGFAIDRSWHQEFEYDLLGWSQSALNYLLPKPNLFFNIITGKPADTGPIMTAIAIVSGVALTILLIPALLAGTWLRRGGTLIVAASTRSGQ